MNPVMHYSCDRYLQSGSASACDIVNNLCDESKRLVPYWANRRHAPDTGFVHFEPLVDGRQGAARPAFPHATAETMGESGRASDQTHCAAGNSVWAQQPKARAPLLGAQSL
jgi:hypothetical protein